MSRGRQPKSFAPGAKLDSLDRELLEQVGFQPGFPLFGTPSGEQASDLQKIIHALTFEPCIGEAHPQRLRPVILQSASVPGGSERSKVVSTLMEVREFRRAWSGEQPYWYLGGQFAGRPLSVVGNLIARMTSSGTSNASTSGCAGCMSCSGSRSATCSSCRSA